MHTQQLWNAHTTALKCTCIQAQSGTLFRKIPSRWNGVSNWSKNPLFGVFFYFYIFQLPVLLRHISVKKKNIWKKKKKKRTLLVHSCFVLSKFHCSSNKYTHTGARKCVHTYRHTHTLSPLLSTLHIFNMTKFSAIPSLKPHPDAKKCQRAECPGDGARKQVLTVVVFYPLVAQHHLVSKRKQHPVQNTLQQTTQTTLSLRNHAHSHQLQRLP